MNRVLQPLPLVGGYLRRTLEQTLDRALDRALAHTRSLLLEKQAPDGHWCFEFEADCTIPAEFILMQHYMDERDAALESKMAVYLRSKQADHGGWPLYYGGHFDLSASVKAYYALKLAGDAPDLPPHASCQRSHSRPWRCRTCQCIHQNHFGLVRSGAVACRALHPGGSDAFAALVSFSDLQGGVLVADRHGASFYFMQSQGPGQKSLAGAYS
jgi:Prenyltransferase and squalene oxidase repeat.